MRYNIIIILSSTRRQLKMIGATVYRSQPSVNPQNNNEPTLWKIVKQFHYVKGDGPYECMRMFEFTEPSGSRIRVIYPHFGIFNEFMLENEFDWGYLQTRGWFARDIIRQQRLFRLVWLGLGKHVNSVAGDFDDELTRVEMML